LVPVQGDGEHEKFAKTSVGTRAPPPAMPHVLKVGLPVVVKRYIFPTQVGVVSLITVPP
jgi:hypothetical protein